MTPSHSPLLRHTLHQQQLSWPWLLPSPCVDWFPGQSLLMRSYALPHKMKLAQGAYALALHYDAPPQRVVDYRFSKGKVDRTTVPRSRFAKPYAYFANRQRAFVPKPRKQMTSANHWVLLRELFKKEKQTSRERDERCSISLGKYTFFDWIKKKWEKRKTKNCNKKQKENVKKETDSFPHKTKGRQKKENREQKKKFLGLF